MLRKLKLAKVLVCALAAAAAALNLYLRYYPLVRPGCQFAADADVKLAAFGDPQIPGLPPFARGSIVKHVDVLGNDKYLAGVARAVRTHARPDIVAVLGDLISSQWIDTGSFFERADRFAKIFPPLDTDVVYNISGNHDIGYHGDFTTERLSRFEVAYGKLNFVAQQNDEYRIVAINAMSLDGPPLDDEWRNETLAFLKSLEGYKGSTVLLMHVPGFKPSGLCADKAQFEYYEDGQLRSQNHLSSRATDLVFNAAFGSGSGGIVLVGHDHEGCECSYSVDALGRWSASSRQHGFIKEHTVRSMMGDFGGNAGLVSGVRTADGALEWRFTLCRFHVQHIWWVTQVVTYLALLGSPLMLL